MKFKDSLLLTSALLALAASSADAATTVLSYANSAAVTARGDGPFTIGSIFQVNTTGLQITHLGVMDADAASDPQDPDGADGLSGRADDDGYLVPPLSVGLWSWDGTTATLLASATVGNSDAYADGYRYVDITDVALTSGQQYILGAQVGAGIEWFLDGQAQSSAQFSASSGDFTLLKNTYNTAGGLNAPTSDGAGILGRWGPANAIVVPEPSAALLGCLGLLALLRRRR